jgi:WD40 repeat protein
MAQAALRLIFGSLIAVSLCLIEWGSHAQHAGAQRNAQNFPVEIIPSTMNGWSKPVFTADGRVVVLGNGNGAQLWDLEKNRLVRTFVGLTTINSIAALSPNGLQVAAGAGKTINIWNIATGQVEATIDLLMSRINSIVFSKDGTRLVYAGGTVGNQPKMVITEIGSRRIIKSFFSDADVETLDLSSDGTLIGFGDLHGVIRILDINGRPVRSLSHGHRVKDLAFSPSGKLLATGGDDGSAKIWDVASGKLLRTLSGHEGSLHLVLSVSWAPDGSKLATTDSVSLRIWNANTGVLESKTPFFDSTGRQAYVSLATYMPDGRSLLVDAYGVKKIDAETKKVLGEPNGASTYSQFIKGVEIVGDEVYFARGYPREIFSFNFSTHKSRNIFRASSEKEGWSYVSGSKDGRSFVGLDNDKLLFLNVESGKPPSVLMAGLKDCYVTAISPTGELAAAGDGSSAIVVETKTGRVIQRFKADTQFSAGPTELVFSPDGSVLVAAFIGNVIRVLQIPSGKVSSSVTLERYNTISFSPDSKSILVAGTERYNLAVDNRSVENLQIISRLRLPGEETSVKPAYFSPDGKLVIMGNFDGVLRLWDLARGTVVRTFRGHTGPISEVQFISSGRRIVSSANDGFKVWDTNTGELLVTYIISTSNDWLAITPEGFFDSSDNGSKVLSIVRGLEVFSIDQFYNRLHRPDLLQQKLAGDPLGKVRIAAAQLDLTKAVASGSAPSVRITSPRSSSTIDDGSATVEADFTDQGGGLGKVEWRVNGTTFGIDSVTSDVSGGKSISLRRTFALIPGDNRVEVVAYNAQGLVSSDPAVIMLNFPPQQASGPPQLHVVSVGVNDYWDSKLRLSFAVSDANSIGNGLKQAGQKLYEKVELTTMLDANVTSTNLDKLFEEISRRIRPQDVFVFFMSGHGKTVDGRFYFIPQDFRYSGEDSIVTNGIGQDQLQRWFAKISAQKSVLLFDTCESGALIGERIATRGMEDKTAIDLMTRAMGRTVLTATTDDKPAAEGYRGHGVFTYTLLAALQDGDSNGDGLIDVLELANFVDRQVPLLTYDAWKMRQVPQMKIVGSNFPLVSKTTLLPAANDDAVSVPIMATHVVIEKSTVRLTPDGLSRSVAELPAGAQVRVVETSNGWVLIAREGRRLGYIQVKSLATLQ